MLSGTWPIVVGALGALAGWIMFTAGFWMINDLRGELLGRDPEAEPKDMLRPGMWCLVPGLSLAMGCFAVQYVAAFIVMVAVLLTELVIFARLMRRRSQQRQQELAAIISRLPDDD